MRILTLNCGSTSLRFRVADLSRGDSDTDTGIIVAGGHIVQIGEDAQRFWEGPGAVASGGVTAPDHATATIGLLEWLSAHLPLTTIHAVGHRVVHGGWKNRSARLLTSAVIADIEDAGGLAPGHNSAALAAIHACQPRLGHLPTVAVFDAAFQGSGPDEATVYAIPHDLTRRHDIRRLGFHGIAYRSVVNRYCDIAEVPTERATVIALHLGGGCSAAAIRKGVVIDTSMGLTPLEGLVMGTRSGDIDPGLVGYLSRVESSPVADIERILYTASGLLGLSGVSGDMREVLSAASANPRARLAVAAFCYRARKYIGAYFAALGGADAVLFSGGIGEHSAQIRLAILQGLECLGIRVDPRWNADAIGVAAKISAPDSPVGVWVIPADEETVIARDVLGVVSDSTDPET